MWPVIAIIFLSSAPNSAAVVAKPDLKLCPAYLDESKPTCSAYFLIISATDLSEISNIFPLFVLANLYFIYSLSAITGQNS